MIGPFGDPNEAPLSDATRLLALADALAAAVWRFTEDPDRSHRDAGLDYDAMLDAARAYRAVRGAA